MYAMTTVYDMESLYVKGRHPRGGSERFPGLFRLHILVRGSGNPLLGELCRSRLWDIIANDLSLPTTSYGLKVRKPKVFGLRRWLN
ncbi:hypothetical protein V6N13_069349 [Hibiscus sabdariffa]